MHRAAGQRAIQRARRAAAHGHGLAAKLEIAVAEAGGAHCIADEYHALCAFGAQQQTNHGRMHVQPVADELRQDAVVVQHRAQGAWRAMMQAGHAVEGVRRLVQAAFSSRQHRLVVCTAVPDGEFDAMTPGLRRSAGQRPAVPAPA